MLIEATTQVNFSHYPVNTMRVLIFSLVALTALSTQQALSLDYAINPYFLKPGGTFIVGPESNFPKSQYPITLNALKQARSDWSSILAPFPVALVDTDSGAPFKWDYTIVLRIGGAALQSQGSYGADGKFSGTFAQSVVFAARDINPIPIVAGVRLTLTDSYVYYEAIDINQIIDGRKMAEPTTSLLTSLDIALVWRIPKLKKVLIPQC